MNSKHARSKSIGLYTRTNMYITVVLIVIILVIGAFIYHSGTIDTSTWIGTVLQLVHDLYPGIFLIPITFFISSFIFGPTRQADQDARDEQFVEKMKEVILPALEEKLVASMKELIVPMAQTMLTSLFQNATSMQEMGITAIKPHINFGELRDCIIQSKERVYLSDTLIFYQFNEFEEALKQVALQQIPLRILLLDPKSPVAQQRRMDLYGNKGQKAHISKLSIPNIANHYKSISLTNLELRFHSSMPAMQIFIYDNKAIVGFYFHGQDSQILPQLEVLIKDEKGEYTLFGKLIEAEFENKWNVATPVPL